MNQGLYIGIDLGGTNIKGALITREGKIICKKKIPTQALAGAQAVAEKIAYLISELAQQEGHDKGIRGVGIGVPGQPDRENGTVIFAPNMSWHHVPLVQMLNLKDVPVFLENDANLAALGEQWVGAGWGSQNMVMITIGTGIGAGIILGGQLFTGANGCAGELGHCIIDPRGPACSCGRRGCLETFCSANAMVKSALSKIGEGAVTKLADIKNIEARDIIEAAREQDQVALEVMEATAAYLGMGLGNVVNLLNPDTIVIGGGVSAAGDILFSPLRDHAVRCSLAEPCSSVKIVPALLGNDAGTIGAAKLVMDKLEKKG